MIAARLPAIFGIAGFPALWVSLSLAGLAASISQIALSWTTLELTASPLGVALTLAVRMVPSLLLGIPLGAVSDRVDRRRLIRSANLVAGGVGLLVAGLAFGGLLGVPAIVAFSFVFGIIDTARTTATQAYVYDLVGADRATNGLAMSNLGAQLFGSAGAILGGVLIAAGGLGSGFGVATAGWLVAAIVLGRTRATESVAVDRLTPSARSALTLLGRNREVRWILVMVIVTEVLGFSSMTLTPTFARDVLDVGAAGLGVLVAGRSIGAVIGLLRLTRVGAATRTGRLLLSLGVAFGLLLVVFALSGLFPVSLVVMFVIGAVAAGVDTLAQTLLQHATDDHQRGASMGVWVFGVGFGPIGFIGLGAAAAAFGAPAAQAVAGALLVAMSLVVAVAGPIRRLR